jgi:hypothetical protein
MAHEMHSMIFWSFFSLFLHFDQKGDLFARELAALEGERIARY